MKPAIAVQAIFTFVSSWNNYFIPALILHDDSKKTLPILIAQLRAADWLKFDMGQVYIMIAFSIFPVIVVYLILSKHIVQGVALGSVKGQRQTRCTRKLVRQLRLKVLVTYRRGSEYKSLSFQFHGNVSRLIRIQKQNGGLLFVEQKNACIEGTV